MAGNVPDLKVEIAFATTNAFDTAPTWTNVTSYVLDNPGCSIQRGRANELSTFSAGRATLTLNNQDGRFSPLNASSPYVGQLLPRKQIRITATWAATDYIMFKGYVTGWPQTYSAAKKMAMVPLECYDMFAILNETTLPDAYYAYQNKSIGSLRRSFRRFVNRSLVDAVSGDVWPARSSAVSGSADLFTGLSGSDAVNFNAATSFYGQTDTDASVITTYSFSAWVNTGSATDQAVFAGNTSAGVANGVVGFIAGSLDGKFYFTTTAGESVASVSSLSNGQPHHIVVTKDNATTTVKIYIDGTLETTSNTGVSSNPWFDMIGNEGTNVDPFFGQIQDVACFSKALSATEVRDLYRTGIGNVREDTATRFGRVCDAAGVASALRNTTGIATPYGACQETWDTSATALAQLQLIAATEQGVMHVGRTGLITLLHRYWHQDAAFSGGVIQCTFSDDGADSQYVDLGFDYDDLNIQNQITISSGAGSAFYLSQTSIDKYGLQDQSITTQLGSYSELRTMAEGLTYWRKDPAIRSRPLTVYPQQKTSTWPTILGLDIAHRVRYEITAPGHGSQYQASLLIQQLDWDISSTDWAYTIQGSPIPASFGLWDSLVLDTDILGF